LSNYGDEETSGRRASHYTSLMQWNMREGNASWFSALFVGVPKSGKEAD